MLTPEQINALSAEELAELAEWMDEERDLRLEAEGI